MAEDVIDAGLLLADADRYGDGTEPRDREEGEREFDAVAKEEANAVAALDAALRKSAGRLRDALPQAFPGEPRLAADQRLARRVARRGLLQHRNQAARPLGVALHRPVEMALRAQGRYALEPRFHTGKRYTKESFGGGSA